MANVTTKEMSRAAFDRDDPFKNMPYTENMLLPEAYSAVDDHITADWMQGAIEFCLRSQKHFAEYLGVGPSTVTGWVKAKAYPDQVKRLLVFTMLDFMNKKGSKSELSMLRAKVADAYRREVLAADNSYCIAEAKSDDTGGRASVRKIIARDIPELDLALRMAGSDEVWCFVEEFKKSVLMGELENDIMELCAFREVDPQTADEITDEIKKRLSPMLAKFNSLWERWTDPKTLKAESSYYSTLSIDWDEAFPVPSKNAKQE